MAAFRLLDDQFFWVACVGAPCPAPQFEASRPRGILLEAPNSGGRSNVSANRIYFGDNLPILEEMESGSVDLIYIDPPFNTGKRQERTRIRTVRSEEGDRTGFQGKRYRTLKLGTRSFGDAFDDYLGFLEPRLLEAHRVLSNRGSIYFHVDYREVHYSKLLLDEIFGRDSFLNEIIWAYDYGARTKKKWSAKHDNILLYVKGPDHYTFNADEIERIPYMAPGLVGPEKAARGKLPTDTWWHTIVPTNAGERTGYPTQKPLGILRRIIAASSNPGDLVLDFFAGSGTTGAAALELGRRFVLVDDNREALDVMARRFRGVAGDNLMAVPAGKVCHGPLQLIALARGAGPRRGDPCRACLAGIRRAGPWKPKRDGTRPRRRVTYPRR
jgi:site-specific DNA-methyltransferase (adenine-specific)